MMYCMLMFCTGKGKKQDINRAGVIEKQVGKSVTLKHILYKYISICTVDNILAIFKQNSVLFRV